MKCESVHELDSECYFGRHAFEGGVCVRPNCGVNQANVISIDARRWFNTRVGSTYHSVYVVMPDGTHQENPYEYGYDAQWMDTAMKLISDHLKEPVREKERLHSYLARVGYYCLPRVTDVGRKRDL